MKTFQEFLDEAQTYYNITHKTDKSVLSTHDNEKDAKDELDGLGKDKDDYIIKKSTKKPKTFGNFKE